MFVWLTQIFDPSESPVGFRTTYMPENVADPIDLKPLYQGTSRAELENEGLRGFSLWAAQCPHFVAGGEQRQGAGEHGGRVGEQREGAGEAFRERSLPVRNPSGKRNWNEFPLCFCIARHMLEL